MKEHASTQTASQAAVALLDPLLEPDPLTAACASILASIRNVEMSLLAAVGMLGSKALEEAVAADSHAEGIVKLSPQEVIAREAATMGQAVGTGELFDTIARVRLAMIASKAVRAAESEVQQQLQRISRLVPNHAVYPSAAFPRASAPPSDLIRGPPSAAAVEKHTSPQRVASSPAQRPAVMQRDGSPQGAELGGSTSASQQKQQQSAQSSIASNSNARYPITTETQHAAGVSEEKKRVESLTEDAAMEAEAGMNRGSTAPSNNNNNSSILMNSNNMIYAKDPLQNITTARSQEHAKRISRLQTIANNLVSNVDTDDVAEEDDGLVDDRAAAGGGLVDEEATYVEDRYGASSTTYGLTPVNARFLHSSAVDTSLRRKKQEELPSARTKRREENPQPRQQQPSHRFTTPGSTRQRPPQKTYNVGVASGAPSFASPSTKRGSSSSSSSRKQHVGMSGEGVSREQVTPKKFYNMTHPIGGFTSNRAMAYAAQLNHIVTPTTGGSISRGGSSSSGLGPYDDEYGGGGDDGDSGTYYM